MNENKARLSLLNGSALQQEAWVVIPLLVLVLHRHVLFLHAVLGGGGRSVMTGHEIKVGVGCWARPFVFGTDDQKRHSSSL